MLPLGTPLTNNAVMTWSDQTGTGNNVNAKSVSTAPLLISQRTPSGQSALSFGGVASVLTRTSGVTSLPAGATDRTLFVIVKYTNSIGWGGVSYGTAGCGQMFGLVRDVHNNLSVQGYCSDYVSSTGSISNGWLSHSAVLSASALTAYKDTTKIATATFSSNTVMVPL